jgi:hypothetical protein
MRYGGASSYAYACANKLAACTHIQAGDCVLGAMHCIQRQADLAAVLCQVLHGLQVHSERNSHKQQVWLAGERSCPLPWSCIASPKRGSTA